MAGKREFWTPEHEVWFHENPEGTYWDFVNDHGSVHTFDGWRMKRARVLGPRRQSSLRGGAILSETREVWRRSDTPPGMPVVEWDKHEADFHWTDLIEPTEEYQRIARAASGSQDFAQITIDADRPTPILFLSDWHFGSWGTSLLTLLEMTQRIVKGKYYLAILGDMIQLAILMRNMLEVSDNLLAPRFQHKAFDSWLGDLAPQVLWSTWDNHPVHREEKLTGFSHHAEALKEKAIHHSGIGHIDLTVGKQTYKIASSHRFRGNSYMNPTHGQSRYMRFEGIDRELTIAGDSHRPAHQIYTDGPMTRLAINCGTMQTDSGYAKRHFSLYTHDWMPVVVFDNEHHLMTPYPSLDHYERMLGSR